MDQTEKDPTPLQLVLQKLGGKNSVVHDTLAQLQAAGIKATKSALYNVIAGRTYRKEYVDVLLTVAEAEVARRKQVEERASRLVATA